MADISTAVSMARVPILGENGRISDDYIPAAIGEGVESAEAAATRAETAATSAEDSASAASTSATQASGSASAASASASQAQQSAAAAGGAATSAQSAQTAAEAAQSAAAGSAQDAQQSATAAQQSAASVADKFITSAQATTLEPGSQATASVDNQVLTIGVPKGDKGDKGEKGDTGTGVPDGGTPGQLLSKTDSGTAWVDPPSGNVLTGTTSAGYVAHAEDAYAQKPIEVRVKGRTVKNLWPYNASSESAGINATMDKTGLITLTGTASTNVYFAFGTATGAAANKSYTLAVSNLPSGVSVLADSYSSENAWLSTIAVQSGTTATGTTHADMAELRCMIRITNGTTVNASFRAMLVEGDTAPDCFVPTGLHSVEPTNLVTAGAESGESYEDITNTTLPSVELRGLPNGTADELVIAQDGTCEVERKTVEITFDGSEDEAWFDSGEYFATHQVSAVNLSGAGIVCDRYVSHTGITGLPDKACAVSSGAQVFAVKDSAYSDVSGFTDALHDNPIKVVFFAKEQTTEPQSPVTLPQLPAPTFNAYHDSQVPSDTTVTYERDVNIVIDNLTKQVAGTASAVAVREASTIEEE